jgi:hypothetical protein
VLALAVDHEHATFSSRAHRAKEQFELSSSFLYGHSMQIQAAVDRKEATAHPAQHLERQVDASPLDASPVVGHFESRPSLDESTQSLLHRASLDLRGLTGAPNRLLRALRALDTNLGDAATRPVERPYPCKETMEIERVVGHRFIRRTPRFTVRLFGGSFT